MSVPSTIAIVGVTLGLGFGGGLLIKDVETGEIPKEDVFGIPMLYQSITFCI